MPQIPSDHAAIDRRLVDALFDIVPDDWKAFRLSIRPPEAEDGPLRLAVVNPDVAGADAVPDAPLRAAADELAAFLAREGRAWEVLSYSGHLGADDEWHLKIVVPLPD
ncbi:hypothetical protein MWN34_03355 [Ancylobacter sp. 6x-1]|uniref:DUF3168 domain-containing protein n=1 Tax=Ancylobacter crimeensis TaxID=2579147 RepID=A0ABT0D7L5_9HYPH|nr:hypothetical protein [Ancylobacter crimeensis]MCK0195942.1 hypothetical protein [Ancylobacter crimeensis]